MINYVAEQKKQIKANQKLINREYEDKIYVINLLNKIHGNQKNQNNKFYNSKINECLAVQKANGNHKFKLWLYDQKIIFNNLD